MTVHIAAVGDGCAVLLSDSQRSTQSAAIGGGHKQYVGERCGVGFGGWQDLIDDVSSELVRGEAAMRQATVAEVEDAIERKVSQTFTPEGRANFEAILVGNDLPTGAERPAGSHRIMTFRPEGLTRFSSRGSLVAIGSGSDRVTPMMARDHSRGEAFILSSLVDLFLAVHHYARVASEDPGVNERYALCWWDGPRAYSVGDADIDPHLAPEWLQQQWGVVAREWENLWTQVRRLESEVDSGRRRFSEIRQGRFGQRHADELLNLNQEIADLRSEILDQVLEFERFYDGLRPSF